MTDHIKREDVLALVDKGYLVGNRNYNSVTKLINSIPSADVMERKKGKWDDSSVSFYRKCSECGCCVEWNKKPFLFGIGEYNFCPNCGADMRKEEGE